MKKEFYDLVSKSEYLSRYRLTELAMIGIELARLGIVKEEFCNVQELFDTALYGTESDR